MIRIHDVENNTIIDREMTAQEIAAFNINEQLAEIKAQTEAKAAEKAAVLAKLGLTAEELAAALS